MTKPDYTEFDKALLAQIDCGCNTMAQLETRSQLRLLAEPFRTKDRWGIKSPYFRIIDRRLQALRKRGLIRFTGKNWVQEQKRW